MKQLIFILIYFTLGFILQSYTPWWSIAILSFVLSFTLKPNYSFLLGFLSGFLLWFSYAFWIDTKNNHLLSEKMANLFPLGGNYLLLLIITGLIAALVSGFSALAGKQTTSLLNSNPQPRKRYH